MRMERCDLLLVVSVIVEATLEIEDATEDKLLATLDAEDAIEDKEEAADELPTSEREEAEEAASEAEEAASLAEEAASEAEAETSLAVVVSWLRARLLKTKSNNDTSDSFAIRGDFEGDTITLEMSMCAWKKTESFSKRQQRQE
jgi:hypothetical protein